MARPANDEPKDDTTSADWQRRVVGRSLRTAAERSVDRGRALIDAAAVVLERSGGDDITVQEVADEAGQSLRTLYQYFASKDDLLLAVFEEAMRTYALLIERAISDLTDPLERLAGAMIAAARMPERSGSGLDRGLVRLRLKLSEVDPDLVGRAPSVLTAFVGDLVRAAADAGQLEVADPEAATFMLLSLNASFITAATIGNDAGVRSPDVAGIASFCLRGLGADLSSTWYDKLSARLQLPRGQGGPRGVTTASRKAARRSPKK
jgi:AcrR family transcriptional regulator